MNPKAEQTMWVAFIDHLKQKDKLPVVAFTLSRNRYESVSILIVAIVTDYFNALDRFQVQPIGIDCHCHKCVQH